MTQENAQVSPDPRQKSDILAGLKQRADLMGLKYHHKIGIERLRTMIENQLNLSETQNKEPEKEIEKPKKEITESIEEINDIELSKDKISSQKSLKDTDLKPATRAQIIAKRKREASKLVRVRITCMNPAKKDWKGEIISVGSAKLGTFKKFIPFDGEPFHIPFIIYQALLERKFSTFRTIKSTKGIDIKRTVLVSEFGIEVLPPLTPSERERLRDEQARTGRLKAD